jgi:hypothetical protein
VGKTFQVSEILKHPHDRNKPYQGCDTLIKSAAQKRQKLKMSKQTNITCDRCSLPIIHSDALIAEQLAADYPGQDICHECDMEIQLNGEVAKQAALTKESPGKVLQSCLAKYD